MKKYVLFFISIGLILAIILVYNIINVEESKKVTFAESGYILNGSSDRYYFYQDETYTTSYNDQIVFYDTEGAKVTLNNDNFIHYSSGNVVALQDSVLLDLSKINDNPIIYYNVAANKEIKKISNRYTVKNLGTDLQFEQAIWKISGNKYIILANNLTVTLNNGMTKEAEGYVEVEYFDNEIVNIYNQEFSYQTISSNTYVELQNGIKINLGTKIVSQNDENKMALEDMVINSDDNVTLVDLTPETEENTENQTDTNETNAENEIQTAEGQGGTSNAGTTSSSSSSSSSSTTSSNTTVIAGSGSGDNTSSQAQNQISIETPEIIYEYVDDNENKVDESVATAEPVFKLENMEVTAIGITGNIQITDDDDLLSKNDNIVIKIINNATGKTVYQTEESYGTFSIPVNVETLLPDTSYTILATATYTVSENTYTKNFLYKTFVTSSIGVAINKDAFTDNSLSFNISFSDELITSVDAVLLDASGNEIANRRTTIRNTGSEENVIFDGLTANTDYIVRISNITYDGIIQDGENWIIDTPCKTLKTKASINRLNYSINKRDGTFTLYIDDVTDENSSIQSYQYILYKFTQIQQEDGTYSLDYDTENIAYQRETTSKEITITVGEEDSEEAIIREQYYGFQVIATTYDNEKYVEIESSICGAFALNGATFPTVKFERLESDYPPTEIVGWLYIIDNENTITVDENNPLTVTYYSDVVEGEVYVKRTSLEEDEKTTDSSGNEVIKLWVDLGESGSSNKGLKAETSYTFSVYGTVDLKDGNGEYKNVHIGSSIVTTGAYETLTANLTTADISANAFTVELNLEGNEVAKEGLSSVNIMLYEGSGDINTGEYNNWSRTITTNNYGLCLDNAKYATPVNSLQDLLFDNTLVITPSFIGGGLESSYTEVNYQVVVTATIDGTNYSNKIPIETAEDGNEDTGNTTYTDNQSNETYTASYIIVDGKGTTSEVTEELGKITATAITNANANRYNLEKRTDLLDSTYVGYSVGTDFANTGSLTAKEITYYVWDEKGNPVLNEDGTQLTQTLRFTNQEKAPSAVFELNYGTISQAEEDNKSGMHRGCAYFFSYTVTYTDTNGNDIIWPISESNETITYDNQSLKTDIIYPNKQEPNFTLYPSTSDENSITYIYSCIDPDKALRYEANSTTESAYLTLSVGGTVQMSNIEIKTDGLIHDVVIGGLSTNTTYVLGCTINLNKVRSTAYSSKDLVTQRFEGIVNASDIHIGSINYNDANDPNTVRIQLTGSDVTRVAAAVVTFNNGSEEMSTKLLKLDTENGNYIDVDLLDLVDHQNFINFINRNITVKVTVYYDNGRIGFNTTDTGNYATYTNSNNAYLKLENNNLVTADSINGNIFEYRFTTTDSVAQLGLRDMDGINSLANGITLELQYSEAGLKQNGNVIVQKQLATRQVDESTTHTINIQNLRLGLKVNSIGTTISTANISATTINPLNLQIDELVVEIWHAKDSSQTPNWAECETRTISMDEIQNFELDNLAPAEYYYIRFKYMENSEYVYTYDTETKEVGRVYTFETLATIGINDLKIEYVADNYTDKSINISYYLDRERSNMYEKTRYTFYEMDGITKVSLTENNIIRNNENSNYQIIDGSLVVTNSNYPDGEKFNSILEKVSISPQNNVFTMGKDYILKITPIVTIQSSGTTEECEIETVSKQFNLKQLKTPTIGLKMERRQATGNSSKYVRIVTTIQDADGIISGSDWGEYELHVYKYKYNREEAVEVDIYDNYQNGTKVTGNTFNLRDHSVNYSVYIQNSDIDYSYNYVVEMKLKYDKTNTGENLEEHTEQYTLRAIDNDANVSIGSAVLIQSGNICEVRFYDSYYNIDRIDKIDYTIIELTNNYNQTSSFKPDWTLINDTENGIAYYKFNLPTEFQASGVYTIQMNLYAGNTLVGQIDTTYIYEQPEQEESQG